jgi:sugar/nucleoside kinase (ribokinase family)
VKGTARRTFFHYRGANRLFAPQAINLDNLSVEIFHLGYLLLLDSLDQPDEEFQTMAARFLYEVQKRNFRTSIDVVSEDSDRFNKIVPPALKYTNYCIINDFEAEKISGIPLRSRNKVLRENLRKMAKNLFGHGVNDLVVIHFPEGAYLSSKDGQEIMQASLLLPDDFIAGSAGAGDALCAGVLYGLYQGWSYDQTLRFAVCAGGMNLSDLTTTGGIRSCGEIFNMEERFPYRTDVF